MKTTDLPSSLRIALITIACFLVAEPGSAADPEMAALFGNDSGCALLLTRDRHRERLLEYGPDQCRLAQSPCSTFKIPNALIGLQTSVVEGPDHAKAWDGVERDRPETNRDQTLASAIRDSVVWYFQDLARDVGEDRMQEWLDRLDYGNRDISGGIDRFWLGSSLLISPQQQLEFVKRLKHGTLPIRPGVQRQVRDMLLQSSELDGELHGKTGSCNGDAQAGIPDHGWFVGWIDWKDASGRNPTTTFFVVNVRGDQAWGTTRARPIALQLLAGQRP